MIAAPAVTLAVAARIADGGLRPQSLHTLDGLLVGAGLLGLAVRVLPTRAAAADGENPPLDLGAGVLCLALGYAATSAAGGLSGPLSAFPLLVLATVVALGPARRTWVVAVCAVLLLADVAHQHLSKLIEKTGRCFFCWKASATIARLGSKKDVELKSQFEESQRDLKSQFEESQKDLL